MRCSHRLRGVCATLFAGTFAAAAMAGGPPCDSDLDGDGIVGGGDLGILLAEWGLPGGDLNGDGTTDGVDLGILLAAWGTDCPAGEPTATELVGVSLDEYPWLQIVQAWNRSGDIVLGIDPTAFPELGAFTGDVYVTADRSAVDWSSDPALVDIRTNGVESIAFGGVSHAANRVVLDRSGLSAPSDGSMSNRYDVVVDVNRNGQLDGGDLIDGLDGPGLEIIPNVTIDGPYAVTTLASYSVTGPTAGFRSERTYYPSNIDELGARPLVVISHGNGHQYTWYDYLGEHLASWGYVVMSHQNNTVPGIESCSLTTLQHTDAFLGQLGSIGGGVLDGLVDGSQITWIGHSRGGEGVARAYDRIRDGSFNPSNYDLGDIKLISSIAPTDFLGTNSSNPYEATYHLLYGSADGDVCGCPNNDIADSFNVYERSFGFRQSTYLHGADHNDFNCCGFNDFTGPSGTALGRTTVQGITKGVYLLLIRRHIDGEAIAEEYMWRQYEAFRPTGTPSTATVVHDIRPTGDVLVIDDFQTNTGAAVSTIGGAVTFSASNYTERSMHDNNTSFTWLASDPMNGATRGRTSDSQRAIVFDYSSDASVTWEIPGSASDLSGFSSLQFRAAQGTRHPDTTAVFGDQDFEVVLIDGDGDEQAISIGAYGGGIEEPYQRTGFGTGAGWQNEYEVIRIRLAEFTVDGSSVDLDDIAAIRLDFGPSSGTSRGRISVDDLIVLP